MVHILNETHKPLRKHEPPHSAGFTELMNESRGKSLIK